MTTQVYDPFASLDTVTEESVKARQQSTYWGQVQLNAWACALVKGQGKVPFDPQQHKRPVAAITLDIFLLPEHGAVNPYVNHREMVEFEVEWYKFTLQSIHDLQKHVKDINGLWCKYILTPTGDTYQKNGETRDKTAIKFLQFFASEDACRMDYLMNDPAFDSGQGVQDPQSGTQPPWATQQPATQPAPQPAGNGNGDKEKETGLAFLKVIVENAVKGQTDLNVIRQTVASNIANYPIVSRYFTVDSPETMQLIAGAMQK